MPETAIQKTLAKEQYLNRDKSVKLQEYLEKQKKLEKSGLKGIEVRKTAKQLGKDDFLQLLITQLTHQDPTAPVKDQAFIAQMAQFSSLEQMKNMAGTLQKMSERQAQSLVGKFVIGKDHLTGAQVSGVARAMFYDKSGDAFFKVGGSVVRVNDITLIGNPEDFKQEYGGTAPAVKPISRPLGVPTKRSGLPSGPLVSEQQGAPETLARPPHSDTGKVSSEFPVKTKEEKIELSEDRKKREGRATGKKRSNPAAEAYEKDAFHKSSGGPSLDLRK